MTKKRFPNALAGIRLLIAAQILTVALAVFTAFSLIKENETTYCLILLTAFVLFIIGMVYGKMDEDSFRKALNCMVTSFVLSFLLGLLAACLPTFALILYFPLTIAIAICGLCANYYIVDAIRNLADRKKNRTVSDLAVWTWRIMLTGTLASIVFTIIIRAGAYTSASTIFWVASILTITINTLFLVTLCFAERMLAKRGSAQEISSLRQ